jgi:hypothetical protein
LIYPRRSSISKITQPAIIKKSSANKAKKSQPRKESNRNGITAEYYAIYRPMPNPFFKERRVPSGIALERPLLLDISR